jgi:hypothetical protein
MMHLNMLEHDLRGGIKMFPDSLHSSKQGFQKNSRDILIRKETTLKRYDGTASEWNENLFVIQSENVWEGSCIYMLHDL